MQVSYRKFSLLFLWFVGIASQGFWVCFGGVWVGRFVSPHQLLVFPTIQTFLTSHVSCVLRKISSRKAGNITGGRARKHRTQNQNDIDV